MKKNVILALLCFCLGVQAQNEFPKVWETQTVVEPKWNAWNDDLSMVLLGDLKELEMLDGSTGKSLWTFNVKEKLGVKNLDDWAFMIKYEGEPVKLIYTKPKEKNATVVFLDAKSGQITTTYTDENLKAKQTTKSKGASRAIYKTSTYDQASGTFVMVSYKDKLMTSAMGGTDMELNVAASGGFKWSVTVTAKCVRHLCDNLLSYDEPSVLINTTVIGDKVLLIYEGISVLDIKTGRVLWTTTYDNATTSLGLKVEQEIGRSAFPVGDKDAIYLPDFSKGERCLKKLDSNTGNVVWKSDKLSSDDIVSQLSLVNGILVAKFGGIIRKEKYIPNSNGGGTYKVEYSYEGKTDLRGYEAASGKQVWTLEQHNSKEDNLTKSECNILIANNRIFFCSQKFIYLMNPATGAIITKTDIQPKNIGKPKYMYAHNNKTIVEGVSGLAACTAEGTLVYSVNTGRCLFTEFRGNSFLVWTGKSEDDMNEFIIMDIETGKIFGKKKECYQPRFDQEGNYFLFFNKRTITKYKAN